VSINSVILLCVYKYDGCIVVAVGVWFTAGAVNVNAPTTRVIIIITDKIFFVILFCSFVYGRVLPFALLFYVKMMGEP
jgi:hypothetical protein